VGLSATFCFICFILPFHFGIFVYIRIPHTMLLVLFTLLVPLCVHNLPPSVSVCYSSSCIYSVHILAHLHFCQPRFCRQAPFFLFTALRYNEVMNTSVTPFCLLPRVSEGRVRPFLLEAFLHCGLPVGLLSFCMHRRGWVCGSQSACFLARG
jgi:hypothetical protein